MSLHSFHLPLTSVSPSPSDFGTGLYVHIPFCASRCIYCDFYSTTRGEAERQRYVKALIAEMQARADEAPNRHLRTVYVGGGTPSTLSHAELSDLFAAIAENFVLDGDAEVTLEANPDDVTPQFAALLPRLGVNRVSLGIQTFNDDALRQLRRRHTAEQAVKAVERLHHVVENISVDLIYGLPGQTLTDWQSQLERALTLPVSHLSAYALMYEEGTALTAMRDSGKVAEADEETSLSMFSCLMERTATAGFRHYEISNFARDGFASRHNSSYWSGMPYIGLGPGASSYDGKRMRRANSPSLSAYLAAFEATQFRTSADVPSEIENLTEAALLDEAVFTALRTASGLNLSQFRQRFGEASERRLLALARRHLEAERLERVGDVLRLTRRGIFVSDDVMSDLMLGA